MRWHYAIALFLCACGFSYASAQTKDSTNQTPGMILPSHASNIAMGQWRFVSIAGSAVRAVGNKQPYLKFDGSKNIVTGYSGCNRLRGTYIADESTLTFQHVATTRAACLGDSYERQVLDVLSSATRYKIVDHELHLLGPSGTLAILTRPHEEQTTKSKPAEK